MKNMFSKVVLALAVVGTLFGCDRRETVVYQQPAPVQQQVVYQNNDAQLAAAAITGAALTAVMLNGVLRPGYVYIGGSVYRDTPYVHRYVTTNHIDYRHPNSYRSAPVTAPAANAPVAPTKPAPAAGSFAARQQTPAPVKQSFAQRTPSAPSAPKQSFSSRPSVSSSSSTRSSGGFSSRRK
jgi:hypothetical protein